MDIIDDPFWLASPTDISLIGTFRAVGDTISLLRLSIRLILSRFFLCVNIGFIKTVTVVQNVNGIYLLHVFLYFTFG